MKRIARVLLAALGILLVSLFLFSGWKVYTILHGYKAAERRYDSLADQMVSAPAPAAEPSVSEALSVPEASEAPQTEARDPQDVVWEEYSPVAVDFNELRRLSGDVIGWIYLPDTVINYPIAQGADNDFYLTRFLDGTVTAGGTLFADCVCPSDFSGLNTIIYGHNMKNGSMFALIDDYAEQDFFEAHPVMYLNTPSQNYKVEIFSGFTTDPESFVYTSAFASDEDYESFLRALLSSSEIDCRTEVGSSDHIVTLSTCTYTAEDVRFVLCGKLTPIG